MQPISPTCTALTTTDASGSGLGARSIHVVAWCACPSYGGSQWYRWKWARKCYWYDNDDNNNKDDSDDNTSTTNENNDSDAATTTTNMVNDFTIITAMIMYSWSFSLYFS